jgi:hypothetical protein
MNKSLGSILTALFLGSAATALAQNYLTITNDVWWKDASGNPIYAQGGGICKFNGTYYWYGVQYGGASSYYSTGTPNSDTSFVAVNCYTSTNLVNWTKQNPVVTTATKGFANATWIGRDGGQSVIYNSSSKQYVMWLAYDGTDGNGEACLTCSSPTGNFVLNNVQTSIGNVYNNIPGDVSLFCDYDHGSVPYLIFSDPHGREHAYISTFSSNYLSINAATLISEWPQGQEANNMFCRSGVYYYVMSNLAGWSYSSAYAVWSSSILTPSDYTADAAFAGTTADYTHYSQVCAAIELEGTKYTSYIMMGDRWADFNSDYEKVGYGSGYYVWCPITFSYSVPTYVSLGSFKEDPVDGGLSW